MKRILLAHISIFLFSTSLHSHEFDCVGDCVVGSMHQSGYIIKAAHRGSEESRVKVKNLEKDNNPELRSIGFILSKNNNVMGGGTIVKVGKTKEAEKCFATISTNAHVFRKYETSEFKQNSVDYSFQIENKNFQLDMKSLRIKNALNNGETPQDRPELDLCTVNIISDCNFLSSFQIIKQCSNEQMSTRDNMYLFCKHPDIFNSQLAKELISFNAMHPKQSLYGKIMMHSADTVKGSSGCPILIENKYGDGSIEYCLHGFHIGDADNRVGELISSEGNIILRESDYIGYGIEDLNLLNQLIKSSSGIY